MSNLNYHGKRVKLSLEQKLSLKAQLKAGSSMTFRDMTSHLGLPHTVENICKVARYINHLFGRGKVELKALPKRAKQDGLQPDIKWYTVWKK